MNRLRFCACALVLVLSLSGLASEAIAARLTVSGAATSSIDFTAVGGGDWTYWEAGVHKANGDGEAPSYSQYASPGAGLVGFGYSGDVPGVWSDGLPLASGSSSVGHGVWGAVGDGVAFTVPADTRSRTLTFYCGGWNSSSRLVAHLADGSAPDAVFNVSGSSTGSYDETITIQYASASASTLIVSYEIASLPVYNGNVTFRGLGISVPQQIVYPGDNPNGPPTVGPSASSFASLWPGLISWLNSVIRGPGVWLVFVSLTICGLWFGWRVAHRAFH